MSSKSLEMGNLELFLLVRISIVLENSPIAEIIDVSIWDIACDEK